MIARTLAGIGRFLWNQMALLSFIGVAVLLARSEPGYNHVFGAYLAVSLVTFGLQLWFGIFSMLSLVFICTNLGLCLWMLATGNADIVPYLLVLLFSSMAAVALLSIGLRSPVVFRQPERIAENYLDTGLRAVVALVCLGLSLHWMPDARYISGPLLIYFGFRLAYPLRRFLYPLVLRLAGFDTAGGAPRDEPELPVGWARWKAVPLALCGLVLVAVALPLLLDAKRYDVTIPEPYTFPPELLGERRGQLEGYVATEAGSFDVDALTELGMVFHNLGLFEAEYLDRSAQILDRALFLDPDHARALAWHGSNEVAFALYSWQPVARMTAIARGMRELNRAVELAPDDPEVRLARIDVCLGVPRFVGLLTLAGEDVAQLLRIVEERPEAVENYQPFIDHRAGDVFALLGRPAEARVHLVAALAAFPANSEYYQTIAASLHRLEASNNLVPNNSVPADPSETSGEPIRVGEIGG